MKSPKNQLKDWLKHERPDRVRVARLAQYELQSLWVDLRGRVSPRQRALVKELQSQRGLRLHIASGPHKKQGWINVDGAAEADVQLDLRRAMPFASGSVAMIFSEHFFDHLQFPDMVGHFASECYRVLEVGGRLRLVMHDAELLAKAYLARDKEFFRQSLTDEPPYVATVNQIFRFNGFHQFIHDFESVELVLRRAGFETVLKSSFNGSEVAELNLDFDGPDRAIQSLYVEAVKTGQPS